jgi:hypothetical protein
MMSSNEIVDMVFEAIDTGNALTIETKNNVYEDCAILETHQHHITIDIFDTVKETRREIDIQWSDICKIEIF